MCHREGFIQQYIPKMVARSLKPGNNDIIGAAPARVEQKVADAGVD